MKKKSSVDRSSTRGFMAAPRLRQVESTKHNSERRSLPRIDIRSSDGITCSVTANHSLLFQGRPYDISMKSVALLVDSAAAQSFKEQELFEFRLSVPGQGEFSFSARLCASMPGPGDKIKIAFTFETPEPSNVIDLAENRAFAFPSNYAINAFLYKPNFFYERTFIRLIALSSTRVQFGVLDTEILLFAGMKLKIYLYEASHSPVVIKVTGTEWTGDQILVSAEILEFPRTIAERVAQSLILDLQLSLDLVKKLGLPTPKISDGLKFRFIKTDDEYIEVLKLRFKAYQLAGKVADGRTYSDMASPLDHVSRILVAYHGNRIVASIAIAFPETDDTVLDTERAFPNGYPKRVPQKTDSIEIARLCTDPEYRGSDLLLRIFEHTYKTMQCGGRKNIITSTDDKTWPLYKRLGFKKTGMKYAHPYLSGLVHHVITIHVDQPQNAVGIGALRWNYLYRDMNSYLEERQVIRVGLARKGWLAVFRSIGKVFKIRTKQTS